MRQKLMAYSVESRTNNPANQLREALDQAERQIVNVDASTVESFFVLLDRIEQMFAELAQSEIDLRPEETRWQSLLNRISSQPRPLVRAANGAGGLAALRAQHPPAEGWWWHIDAEVAQRTRRTVIRIAATVAAIVVVVAGVLWGVNYFFPPNPETIALIETTGQLDQLILEERWDEALAVVEQGLQRLPDSPELLIWESVLAARTGDQARADTALARAQEVFSGDPAQFWVAVGNTRLQTGDIDGAQAAADRALELNEEEPQAYFLLGGIAEIRGDVPTAVAMFDRTFALAEDNNPQLAVIAKVRLGYLLQRPAGAPGETTPEPTPEPTPSPAQ
jgi:tetratricopeptide (TPR) repeat protein